MRNPLRPRIRHLSLMVQETKPHHEDRPKRHEKSSKSGEASWSRLFQKKIARRWLRKEKLCSGQMTKNSESVALSLSDMTKDTATIGTPSTSPGSIFSKGVDRK